MTTWLLGGTSIYASSIYFFAANNNIRLRPFCSKHAKWPLCDSWDRIDLETQPDIAKLLSSDPPSLLIYGAGFCNVAQCQANPDYAYTRNVESLKYLLDFLSPKTRLVYLSSDHVFGGGLGPYNENSTPHPISVYGKSKLAAEELVRSARPDALVIRTGLVLGPSISGRHGHLDWLRYRSNNNLRGDSQCSTG
jgi:dTDP-4-dehydrorhamnose reductase